jgi:predicted nucleotidyltransferase
MEKMDPRFKVIVKCTTGSHLYGTATEKSDLDIRGVFIPTEEFYLGFINRVEQVESHTPDETYWEITKFFKLCLDNNPNILELLFIPQSYIDFQTEEWTTIIGNRNLFLSTKARHTFSRYAVSQLHRIRQHREWLLNPPTKKPERKDFSLPETNLINKDQINAYDELISRGEVPQIGEQTLLVLQHEKSYFNALRYWQQYQEWRDKRNKDRADLEGKFGYDTRHASHLFRLVGEGLELLTSGNITFPRPDARDLLDIREGKYTYDELMARLKGDVDTAFILAEPNFILPHSPRRKEADELCQQLVKNRLGYLRRN